MKSAIKSVVTLEMTGEEFTDLCRLIDFGRMYLGDFVKELESEKTVDGNLVKSHKRLIDISKLYTNLRAGL